MIKDNIKNASMYYNISQNLQSGLYWLQQQDFNAIDDGRCIINNDIFANIQSYETKDDAQFEAHRKYIDIQYMINGEEFVEIADYKDCKPSIKYDEDKDVEF